MKIKLCVFLFLTAYNLCFSQYPSLSQQTKVSIFTCGKGQELYTTFGHTAIRIKDDINKLDVVFNYGQFDFREGNFYVKFVKGNLQYCIGVATYEDFIFEYQHENRAVIEQTLNVSQKQKQQLFDALVSAQYSPEESHYTYKFIDRNCTTMVVEQLNAILSQKLISKVDDKSVSYRTVLYPKFDNYFWYKLGINIIFGTKVDQKANQLFLPDELLNSLDKLTINGKPFVEKKEIIVKDSQPQYKFSFFNSVYFVLLLLCILFFINNKRLLNLYFVLSGLLGLFLCFVGLYSLHQELLYNYNALLFNPLFILIPFLKNKIWLKNILRICFVAIVVYLLFMINKPHLFLISPFIIFHLAIIIKKYFKIK